MLTVTVNTSLYTCALVYIHVATGSRVINLLNKLINAYHLMAVRYCIPLVRPTLCH